MNKKITLNDFIDLVGSTGPLPPKLLIFTDESSMVDYANGDYPTFIDGIIYFTRVELFLLQDKNAFYTLNTPVRSARVIKFIPYEKDTILVLVDINVVTKQEDIRK